MTRLAYTPQAKTDLNNIGLFIAKDSLRRAISFVRELRMQCRKILVSPQAYRPEAMLFWALRCDPDRLFGGSDAPRQRLAIGLHLQAVHRYRRRAAAHRLRGACSKAC